MKLFGWVQSRLNGKQGNQKPNASSARHDYSKQEPRKEEFSDWPHGLLTIGTFGNTDRNERVAEIQDARVQNEQQENPSSSPDLSEFTPEEVGQLQKELTKLLKKKPAIQEGENSDLPLDRFLNCPSTLEVSRRISSSAVCTDNPEYTEEEDIERTISVIIGKCKEVRAEKNQKAIGKKSLTFLLKKMFVCSSGFAPTPSLRDPLQESRMEKLLRTILRKKIYPRGSCSSSIKRFIEDKQTAKRNVEETEEKARQSDGSKWVKTDSEYIVLEI